MSYAMIYSAQCYLTLKTFEPFQLANTKVIFRFLVMSYKMIPFITVNWLDPSVACVRSVPQRMLGVAVVEGKEG